MILCGEGGKGAEIVGLVLYDKVKRILCVAFTFLLVSCAVL